MKTLLLQAALRLLVALLADHTRFRDILALVIQADAEHTNNMAKRGFVYRAIKERDPQLTQSAINAMVELGVLVYRARQG
jgi:hypothetical protein